jgi:hypothetical protein
MLKSLITLCLVDYSIQAPQESRYAATVRLTVDTLDGKGYVTDNLPFVENTAQLGRNQPPKKVTQHIIEHAQKVIGKRLIEVDAVLTLGQKVVANKKWSNPNRPIKPIDPGKPPVIIRDRFVAATLVDVAVCGGYNGKFKCDLTLHAGGNDVDTRQLMEDIEFAFSANQWKASCEELCQGLAYAAYNTNNKIMKGVVARVYNKTGYGECRWEEGLELPDFPREATPGEYQQSQERRYAGGGRAYARPC